MGFHPRHFRIRHQNILVNEYEGFINTLFGFLIHHQGIICCVAFYRFSFRRIPPYASVVAPRRLASNTLLVIRNTAQPTHFIADT